MPNARVQLRGREVGAMNAAGAMRAPVSCNDSLDDASVDARLQHFAVLDRPLHLGEAQRDVGALGRRILKQRIRR